MENAELCLKNKFKVGDRVRLNPEAPKLSHIFEGINAT